MPPLKINVTTATRSCLLVLAMTLTAVSALPEEEVPADRALSRLMSGNERFVNGKLCRKDYFKERSALTTGQHPYAVVLTCADSRVPPEILFDESLGRIFTIRVAGNVADPAVLGSIEYAVEHLHTHLLMVLGHDSCGAVKATISGGELPPNIQALANRIKPAVDKVWTQGVGETERLNSAVRENVRYQIQSSLYESQILSEFVHKKELMVVGGVYHLDSGRVEMVSTDVAVERLMADEEGVHAESASAATDEDGEADAAEAEEGHEAAPAQKKVHAARHTTKAVSPPATSASHKVAAPRATTKAPGHDSHAVPAQPARSDSHATGHEEKSHPRTRKAELSDDLPSDNTRVRSFAGALQAAYQNQQGVMLRKSMLLRDTHDSCASDDCRSIPAGEVVQLDNPVILNVMGRPQLKVRYKGKSGYIAADQTALAILVR